MNWIELRKLRGIEEIEIDWRNDEKAIDELRKRGPNYVLGIGEGAAPWG